MVRTSRVLWSAAFLAMAVTGLFNPAAAAVDFFGYQKNVSVTWNRADSAYDSAISYVQIRLGYSQLEISEITAISMGNYLDITEDAWISGSVTQINQPNMTGDFLFKGIIKVPRRAAVTGVQTWIGETMYRAVLKPSQYNYDLTVKDTTSLTKMQSSRIILLQQYTATDYELTLAHVSLGERKHVRIRYMLPNDGGGKELYSIPVLFNPSNGTTPKYCTINVKTRPDDISYFLETSDGLVKFSDTGRVVAEYKPVFNLRSDRTESSVLQMTSFSNGPLQGNYILMNAVLTDSAVGKLSRPVDAVFVWRWNLPMKIVGYINGIKGLTSNGRLIRKQADQMKNSMKELIRRGYRCGLVHSQEGTGTYDFISDSLNAGSGGKAIDYLASFTDQALYSKYQYQADALPSWSVTEAPGKTVVQAARDEYVNTLVASTRLLRDTTIAFRHMILLSAGDATLGEAKAFRELSDSLLRRITVDYTNASWRGVDVPMTFRTVDDQHLTLWDNYFFPLFRATTIVLSIATEKQPYLFTFKGWAADSSAVSGRTDGAWDTVFSWTGYDDQGEVTGHLATKPLLYVSTQDSGCAKLWARDDSHIAEKEDVYPGGTFGILTKATYFQAGLDNLNPDNSTTVPFLQDNEIKAPRSAVMMMKTVRMNIDLVVEYKRGIISVTFARDIQLIELYDLRGRLIARYDARKLARNGSTYLIPMRGIIHSVYIIKIIGKDFMRQVKVVEKGGR